MDLALLRMFTTQNMEEYSLRRLHIHFLETILTRVGSSEEAVPIRRCELLFFCVLIELQCRPEILHHAVSHTNNTTKTTQAWPSTRLYYSYVSTHGGAFS